MHNHAVGPARQAFPSWNVGDPGQRHPTGLNLALRDMLDPAVTGEPRNFALDTWLGDSNDPWNALDIAHREEACEAAISDNPRLSMWLADKNDPWNPLHLSEGQDESGSTVTGNVALDMWLDDHDDPWTPLHLAHGGRRHPM